MCGTAVAEQRDQNVPDVRARENYIACNTWTRSELVVLIRRGPVILGQIDVDSDEPDPFTPVDLAHLRIMLRAACHEYGAEALVHYCSHLRSAVSATRDHPIWGNYAREIIYQLGHYS